MTDNIPSKLRAAHATQDSDVFPAHTHALYVRGMLQEINCSVRQAASARTKLDCAEGQQHRPWLLLAQDCPKNWSQNASKLLQ